MQSLVDIGPVVLEKKTDFKILLFNFRSFVIIFSLENGGFLHLNKLEFSSPKDALC